MAVRLLWADGIELRVEDSAPVDGREPFSAILRTAVRCNNATITRSDGGWKRSGDPTESALLLAAAQLGEEVELLTAERDGRRWRVHHFDPGLKRMTTLDEEADGRLWYHAKGAPLELLQRCSTVRGQRQDRILSAGDRDAIGSAFEAYAAQGLRVLAFAERHTDRAAPLPREEAESGLCFLGLAALVDPPRLDVAEPSRATTTPGSGSSSSPATTRSPPRPLPRKWGSSTATP